MFRSLTRESFFGPTSLAMPTLSVLKLALGARASDVEPQAFVCWELGVGSAKKRHFCFFNTGDSLYQYAAIGFSAVREGIGTRLGKPLYI